MAHKVAITTVCIGKYHYCSDLLQPFLVGMTERVVIHPTHHGAAVSSCSASSPPSFAAPQHYFQITAASTFGMEKLSLTLLKCYQWKTGFHQGPTHVLFFTEAGDPCVPGHRGALGWVQAVEAGLLLTAQFHALKSSSVLCPSCRTLLPSRSHLPTHTHTHPHAATDSPVIFFLPPVPFPRLPSNASVEKVTSSLSPDGVLTVEAPLNVPAIEASETSIPVTVDQKTAVEQK